MKSPAKHRRRLFPWAVVVLPLLAFFLACGPGEEATPTPAAAATLVPTATPTAAPLATSTPTRPGPTATPTPTSVAAPSPTPTPGVQPKRGGVLRINGSRYPASFDQQFLADATAYHPFLPKMYNNLMVNYEGNQIDCEICAEWRLEDGGKTMVFKLLPGIKFHNGKEMTSADVAYSLNMILGQIDGIESPRCGVLKEYIDAIETPGTYDLRIKLARPSVFVQKILSITSCAIYPAGTTRVDLAKGPAGSGPFVLTKAVQGANMSYVRNTSYFKPGLPYLDGVETTFVGDATTTVAAFLTHKTEYYSSSEIPEQVEAQLGKLVEQGKMYYRAGEGTSGEGCWMVSGKPPFSNLKLRQAVNLALDRTAIGEINYGNKHVQQLFFYNEGMEFATPKEKVWDVVPGWGTGAKKQQEIDQAKQLVKDAGHPTGIDVSNIRRVSGFTTQQVVTQEEAQRELAKVGIRVKIEPVDIVAYQARLTAAEWQFNCSVYSITTYDPDEIVGQYWTTGASRNNFAYSNPEVDKLFIQMSGELDPVRRRALFFQIQDIIILKDVAYAPLSSKNGMLYRWDRLQGFTIGFNLTFSNGLKREDRLWLKD